MGPAQRPRWNLDNWYYCDGGFRFRPDGSALEPATGTGQFGQTATDWGDRFYIVQVQPVRYVVPLPHHYLARNPYHGARADTQSLMPYNDVYPISKPDPWRSKRGEDPAWLKFYGEAEAIPNGFITSACGPLIYRATLLPKEYWGNHFCCEEAQNMIHRCLLERDGAGYRVVRQPDPKTEFLASTEEWYRPINLTLGPDGAIYIVDMYREIIEDYSAIPRFLQQQYVESLIAGHDRGRIQRLTVEGAPKQQKFDLRKASVAELVRQLSNDNAWWRETAQRLLVERGDQSAVGPLSMLLREGQTPQARLHALCTLDGLKALEPELIGPALDDPHFAVRTHAVRLAEPWFDRARCAVGESSRPGGRPGRQSPPAGGTQSGTKPGSGGAGGPRAPGRASGRRTVDERRHPQLRGHDGGSAAGHPRGTAGRSGPGATAAGSVDLDRRRSA